MQHTNSAPVRASRNTEYIKHSPRTLTKEPDKPPLTARKTPRHSLLASSASSPSSSPSSITSTPIHSSNNNNDELQRLQAENRKLSQQRMALASKVNLLEEKAKSDAKKIQALELLLQRESGNTGTAASADNSKYLVEMDALSTKIFKLEERSQSMVEEMTTLKADLRNKKKDHEAKMKELQTKHDFEMRALAQQQRDFATGLKKETRRDVDGLKQHLQVQETDLQKKHLRTVQDLKVEYLDREMQLKEVIRDLQDQLERARQHEKWSSIRRPATFTLSPSASSTFSSSLVDENMEALSPRGVLDQLVVGVEEEEGDPDECY